MGHHDSDNQQWRYEPLTGLIHSQKGPGYCLDNRGMAYDGSEISIWRCTDSDNLRFDWYGNTLRNRHDSNISVTASSNENGANIRQDTFDNIDTQKWR